MHKHLWLCLLASFVSFLHVRDVFVYEVVAVQFVSGSESSDGSLASGLDYFRARCSRVLLVRRRNLIFLCSALIRYLSWIELALDLYELLLLVRVGVGLVSGLDLNPREDELYMCMSYGW